MSRHGLCSCMYIFPFLLDRIGGRENYFHCDDCGMCLPNSMQESHACRQDSSKNNCPVCMEVSEFTS